MDTKQFNQNNFNKEKIDDLAAKVEAEKVALSIVERLIEPDVTENFFLKTVLHITHAHYQDITEERAISKMCGYPLCSNRLKKHPILQKYSIVNNKIYDLTDYKNFCSGLCYSSSSYIKDQIPSIPLWLRSRKNLKQISLLKNSSKSYGDEIVLPHIPKKEVEEFQSDKSDIDEVLKVTQHQSSYKACDQKKTSRKMIFLEELPDSPKAKINSKNENNSMIKSSFEVVKQWISPETKHFLNNSLTNENLNIQNNSTQSKLNLLDNKIKELIAGKGVKKEKSSKQPLPEISDLHLDDKMFFEKLEKFYNPTFISKKNSENKVAVADSEKESSLVIIPTVDDHHQVEIRQQILYERLLKCIKTKINLAVCSIEVHLKKLVSTFKLTNNNLMVSEKNLVIVAMILIILLSSVSDGVRTSMESERFKTSLNQFNVSLVDLEDEAKKIIES